MEDHWAFPKGELTEYKKRLIVATVVKFSVLGMMNTHTLGMVRFTCRRRGPDRPLYYVCCCEGGDALVGCQMDGALQKE